MRRGDLARSRHVARRLGRRRAACAPRAISTSVAPSASTRDAPVGFSSVRLFFELDTDAGAEQLETLLRLTERYCVVYQTLAGGPRLSTSLARQ